MVIAKNHLNGIEPDCLRQVAEGGHGYVTGKGSIDAFREEALSNLAHSLQSRGGILQVAAVRQFLREGQSHLDRGIDRPSAIWIYPKGYSRTEPPSQFTNRLDLRFRFEDPCLELDFPKPILPDHPLSLLSQGDGAEGLAVLVFP